MNGYNSVTILGTIASDIKLDIVGVKDTPVAKFSMVNNRKYGGKEEAHFFDVTMWGDRATTFAKFHTKGKPAFIVGELKQERWKDKDSGQSRSRIVVHAHTFSFVSHGDKPAGEAHQEPDRKSNRTNESDLYQPGPSSSYDVDDTPF